MISKNILKAFCLAVCLAISTQSFSQQSVSAWRAQFKGKTDQQAWDMVDAKKANRVEYILGKKAYFGEYQRPYPKVRPTRGTPPPPAGTKKPAGSTELSKDEQIAWLAQADVAILSANNPAEASDGLSAIINVFTTAGYPTNDDYNGILQTLNSLKDKMTAFAQAPGRPLPERMKDIPASVTPQWEEAKAKWTDVVNAAKDQEVVNKMLAELKEIKAS